MKRTYIAGAALVAVAIAAAFYLNGGGRSPDGQPALQKISASTAGEIRNEFNRAKDDVRALLLLSPT